MDGLHEALAAPIHITIEGKPYTFTPLVLADWAEAEAEVVRLHGSNQLETLRQFLAVDWLADAQKDRLVETAWQESRWGMLAEESIVRAWFRTMTGKAFKAWLNLRKNHPEITPGTAFLLVQAMGLADEENYEEHSLGEPSGNSSGRDRPAEGQADAPPGTSFSIPYANPTDGPTSSSANSPLPSSNTPIENCPMETAT